MHIFIEARGVQQLLALLLLYTSCVNKNVHAKVEMKSHPQESNSQSGLMIRMDVQ